MSSSTLDEVVSHDLDRTEPVNAVQPLTIGILILAVLAIVFTLQIARALLVPIISGVLLS